MDKVPSKGSASGVCVTVGDFLRAGGERLLLSLAAGGTNLSREIIEPITNRPGLALTGFFEHFAWERLQLIGKAESSYLDSLNGAMRQMRLKGLFEHKAFCLIFTTGLLPTPNEIAMAEEAGAVILTTPLKTRVFAHMSAFVLESLAAPRTSLYGTTVEVDGLGVMIEGAPGLGKSETALGLVKKGHALIADDLTCIRRDVGTETLYASASDSTAGFMEIRGIGIIHLPSMFGINSVRGERPLGLVITFKRLTDVAGEIDRVGRDVKSKLILGVSVPNVIIPVSEGRDLVNLVETAVHQQMLVANGFDPVSALSNRLKRRADLSANNTVAFNN